MTLKQYKWNHIDYSAIWDMAVLNNAMGPTCQPHYYDTLDPVKPVETTSKVFNK